MEGTADAAFTHRKANGSVNKAKVSSRSPENQGGLAVAPDLQTLKSSRLSSDFAIKPFRTLKAGRGLAGATPA
jgi:hypothetical protein